jgi:hypothetical protein
MRCIDLFAIEEAEEAEEKIVRLVYQGPYQFLTTVPSREMQTYCMNTIFEEKNVRLVYQGPYQFLTTVPTREMQTYRIPLT